MKPFGIAIGLALASATTAAQAQTVISRQITTEPVETVITQGPDGTAVIRRPLGPAPVTSAPATYYDSYARPAPVVSAPASTYYEPYARPAAPIYGASRDVVETVETVEQPAAATTVRREVVRREVVRPRTTTTTRRVQRARAPAARSRSSRTVRTAERVTTRVAPAPAPREVVLTPQQREIVYRTIVREQTAPPVVTREVIVPREPITTFGSRDYYEPISTAPVVAPAPVASVNYVGRILPRSVAFYDVPQSVALNVPATRGFRYAYVDDRVLLVDPVTRMVVEELDE